MIRIYPYEDLDALAEIKQAALAALSESSVITGLETGFDFDRNQVSFLMDFETAPDAKQFEHSKECIALEGILGEAQKVHMYWREDHA